MARGLIRVPPEKLPGQGRIGRGTPDREPAWSGG
jgi:hypothetical protein